MPIDDAWFAKQGMQMTIEHLNPQGISVGKRLRALNTGVLKELKADIEARGMLHPLVVRRFENGQPDLISGFHRLLAVKDLGWEGVPCRVLDVDDQEAETIEIVENLRRAELSAEERREHTLRLTALLKVREKPATGLQVSRGGRGKKGITSKVAAEVGVSRQAVAKQVAKAAEAIGEAIDLERDSPAELRAKADKVRQRGVDGDRRRAKPKPKTPKAEPARVTKPYTDSTGFVHRYAVPQKGDTKVPVAWMQHAPVDEVVKWLARALTSARVAELAERLAKAV